MKFFTCFDQYFHQTFFSNEIEQINIMLFCISYYIFDEQLIICQLHFRIFTYAESGTKNGFHLITLRPYVYFPNYSLAII